MSDYILYTVLEGDRWDSVAYVCYGNANMGPDLMRANAAVPITEFIPEGTILKIPVLEDANEQLDNTNLPPWKQA